MKYKLVEIESIQEEFYDGVVYDLMVEEDHSYNIESICVHNSICETRLATGHGFPVAQSIVDCNQVRKEEKFETLIIADGGCKNGGDIVKALALGADYVMLGSLLSGAQECPGPIISKGKRLYKRYAGMAALISQENNPNRSKFHSVEGVKKLVSFKGPVNAILERLIQNVRSGLSYSGARSIGELQEKAKFIQQTALGMKETGTHIFSVK